MNFKIFNFLNRNKACLLNGKIQNILSVLIWNSVCLPMPPQSHKKWKQSSEIFSIDEIICDEWQELLFFFGLLQINISTVNSLVFIGLCLFATAAVAAAATSINLWDINVS